MSDTLEGNPRIKCFGCNQVVTVTAKGMRHPMPLCSRFMSVEPTRESIDAFLARCRRQLKKDKS